MAQSYGRSWPSPKMWWVLVACLAFGVQCGGESGSSPADVVLAEGYDMWVYNGSPSEPAHELFFQPRDDVASSPIDQQDHAHTFELVDSDGAVIMSVPVDYVRGFHGEEIWEVVFEPPPDYAAYRFMRGSQVFYERRRSASPPEVSILGLEEGQVFAGDEDLEFQVLFDDKDLDILDPVRVLASVDGGDFQPIDGPYVAEPRLKIRFGRDFTLEDYGSVVTVTSSVSNPDSPRIVPAGSQSVQLLIVVSDGTRIAAAKSPVFALEPIVAVPPYLAIYEPADGDILGPGARLGVMAYASEYELEAGELTYRSDHYPSSSGRQVQWASNIDGDVTGRVQRDAYGGFIDPGLSPGIHELTVTYHAESGLQATESVTITILAADDPMAALDDHYSEFSGVYVTETTTMCVTDNDIETNRRIDFDTLRITTAPELGTAQVVASDDTPGCRRQIQYSAPDSVGDEPVQDTLAYEICDQNPDRRCAAALAQITVYPADYESYWLIE